MTSRGNSSEKARTITNKSVELPSTIDMDPQIRLARAACAVIKIKLAAVLSIVTLRKNRNSAATNASADRIATVDVTFSISTSEQSYVSLASSTHTKPLPPNKIHAHARNQKLMVSSVVAFEFGFFSTPNN